MVRVHVLTTGDWTCRRLMEERMVALDFGCDESRHLSDRCDPSDDLRECAWDRGAERQLDRAAAERASSSPMRRKRTACKARFLTEWRGVARECSCCGSEVRP